MSKIKNYSVIIKFVVFISNLLAYALVCRQTKEDTTSGALWAIWAFSHYFTCYFTWMDIMRNALRLHINKKNIIILSCILLLTLFAGYYVSSTRDKQVEFTVSLIIEILLFAVLFVILLLYCLRASKESNETDNSIINENSTAVVTKLTVTMADLEDDRIAYKYNKDNNDLRERIHINRALFCSVFVYVLVLITMTFANVSNNVNVIHIVFSVVISVLMIVINYIKLYYYDKNNRRLQLIESSVLTLFCIFYYTMQWLIVLKGINLFLMLSALFLLIPIYITQGKLTKKQEELYAKKRK